MKKLFVFLLLAVAFSCNTDDTGNVPQGMLRKVLRQPFVGDAFEIRYYYDGHRLDRTEASNDVRTFYYYDGDLIVNIKTYTDTNLSGEQRFTYDDAARLIKRQFLDHANGGGNRSIYNYNPDGTVTEVRYVTAGDSEETYLGTRDFFFAGGEVSHAVYIGTDGATQTHTYTYDNKLVPEHDIVGMDQIRSFDPEKYKGISHNIVTVTQTYSNSPAIDNYAHFWEYNDDGAPTFFTYDDSGTLVIDNGYIKYFYK